MPEDGPPEASTLVAESRLSLRLPLVIRRDYRLAGTFDCFNQTSGGYRQPLAPRFESDKTLDRTLRMNSRQRINRLVAHWAAFPIGINDRGVAVTGKYHGHLVCENADGSFSELAQIVIRLNRIGEQTSKRVGWFAYSAECRAEQRASPFDDERHGTSRHAWR